MKLLHPLSAFTAVLLSVMLNGSALAEQKSMTYTVKTGPVMSRTVTHPGDQLGHSVIRTVRSDMTSSSDGEWDATQVVNYGATDMTAGKGTVAGFAIRTHKNGDQTFYMYQGTLRVVGEGDPPPMAGEGTVDVVGGTGKFANAKGSGTWVSEKGQSTIKLSVEY
jgi:hypothetical protein